MRLQRLDLVRYGKFTGERIDFGPALPDVPDLHIVYGLNEAGKSTALAAYLDLIFGIEERSRYNFLHPYASMQLGGVLEFGGNEHQLARVKQRTNSLLDGSGAPLNEALLSAPLAGLDRDAYRIMFSLDDDSLEQGGNAIIQSKGDLGQLLFSASAGLSGLSSILDEVRSDAEKIHKHRGRTTAIAELKKQLAELKQDRETLDTLASAHSVLVAELEQAERGYAEVLKQRAETRAYLEALLRLQRSAPLAAEHHRLGEVLSGLGDLRVPPHGWAQELPQLTIRIAEARTKVVGAEEDIQRLDADIAGIDVDERLLALRERIDALNTGMDRYTTAASDLPRRRIALAELEARVISILQALGQDGHAAPRQLQLSAPLVGRFRELMEARSGIDARLATAEREFASSKDGFDSAAARIDAAAERRSEFGEAGMEAIRAIEVALANARRSDHQARLQLAERALPSATRRLDGAFGALLPWTGTGEELQATAVPSAKEIELWRARAANVEARRQDQTRRLLESKTQERENSAKLEVIRSQIGNIDDFEAAELRRKRDERWSEHMAALDIDSADRYADALREDDAMGASRLSHAQDLVAMRALRQALAADAVRIAAQLEELERLEEERGELAAEIGEALPVALRPISGAEPGNLVERLDAWTGRRAEALASWTAMTEIEVDLASAKSDMARVLAAVSDAMARAGRDVVEDSADGLLQAAETVLAHETTRQAAQAAAEKALRDRGHDLNARERELNEARAAAGEWDSSWTAALEGTWLVGSGIGAVRETLALLSELMADLGKLEELSRRIELMERDQESFASAVENIMGELGETSDRSRLLELARNLGERREAASRDRSVLEQKQDERERLLGVHRMLLRELKALEHRSLEMIDFFGVHGLHEVAAELERAAEARRLHRRLQELEEQIVAEMRSSGFSDALEQLARREVAEVELAASEASARLEDLEERSRQLFAQRSRAADRMEAVGGDDAVARIEARRRTVLLEIEDKAMSYLRMRAGALVAEKALKVYREKHRSSMMNRASAAFSAITGGNYTGLSARAEKDQEILIGMSRQGGSKLASDMSKGTRFQLYLALRLAGYQEFAQARPSVPFVADDIMESFDEPRSAQVFRLLGEMANIGQVIYLTHHRHLCDMARSVVPGVRVHDLGP